MTEPRRKMRRWALRYRPGTDLARRFPEPAFSGSMSSREAAEHLRQACPNADQMEVVEVEET